MNSRRQMVKALEANTKIPVPRVLNTPTPGLEWMLRKALWAEMVQVARVAVRPAKERDSLTF